MGFLSLSDLKQPDCRVSGQVCTFLVLSVLKEKASPFKISVNWKLIISSLAHTYHKGIPHN